MGNKKALVIGINYKGTGNDLRGCINDAINVSAMLKNSYQFTDITMLIEQEATTAGIKTALADFVRGAVPGDTLYFHYSGHGSQVRDTTGDETDGYDEIICPFDLNWKDKMITDDDLKFYFSQVPNGVNLSVVLDCCHSGSGVDQREEYELEQPQTNTTIQIINKDTEGSRYLPPPPEMMVAVHPTTSKVGTRNVNNTCLLICGCEDTQTSADAEIDGTFQGAATASMLKAVRDTKGDITYRNLVNEMNAFMRTNGFSQRPELNGSSALYDKNFLASWVEDVVSIPSTPVEPIAPPVVAPPAPSVVETAKKNMMPLILGGIIAIVAIVVMFLSH